jgi:hypothetical protein
MKTIRFPNRWHVQCHVLAFPEASFACGLSCVAVGAKDLTLRDLYEDRCPSETGCAHVCDVVALVAEVVELEDDGVSLAAFDARMLSEVLPHQHLVLVPRLVARCSDVGDVAGAIPFVPGPLVFRHTTLAPRVTDSAVWISKAELIDGLFDATATAQPDFHCLEHAFYRVRRELGRPTRPHMCTCRTASLGTSVT